MRTLSFIVFAALILSAVACTKDTTTRAESLPEPASVSTSIGDKTKPEAKITIPEGTKLRVSLLDGVSSDKSRSGDPFLASLTEPVVVDGKTILAKGTRVRGRVVDAQESGRVKGLASLELKLMEIVCDSGQSISISTKPYTAVAEAGTKPATGTKGKEIHFQPEHLLSFTLANPIQV